MYANTGESHAKTLAEICASVVSAQQLERYKNLSITGIVVDSRKVRAGNLFIAVNGLKNDGCTFIDDAVARGAAAVLVEARSALKDSENHTVPVLLVNQLPSFIGRLASNYYSELELKLASQKMKIVGITGTNGKTTVACLVASLLNQMETKVGLLGTLGCGILNNEVESQGLSTLKSSGYTTPDAIQTQYYLHAFTKAHCDAAVMEVSSHALDQKRVHAVNFNIAVLTNLSQDHLDYHGTMEAYAAAKKELFNCTSLGVAVVNIDDAFGQRIIREIHTAVHSSSHADIKVMTYSINNVSADIYVGDVTYQKSGLCATVVVGQQKGVLQAALVGEFNLSNALAAIAVLLQFDFSLSDILSKFASVTAIPGRMQLVNSTVCQQNNNADISLVVDFAHTPDALEKVLSALRTHTVAKLWCVFGCGGDRDKSKRKKMGEIASRCADNVVLTADNPRSETIESITADIQSGIADLSCVHVEHDRNKAIAWAVSQSKLGDMVLIAGKGHETKQILAERTIDFSDHEVAQYWLDRRCSA